MVTFSIEDAKTLPPAFLLNIINKAKQYLKDDEVMQRMFRDAKVDIDFIDFVPIRFGDLDVSARTEKGIITLNYKLLCDGNFFKDFGYLIHECQHWLDQCFGDGPTKGSNNGNYLDNEFEEKAFQNQIEFMANEFGKNEAEKYVDHLLEHHNITNKKDVKEKKDDLMARVDMDKAKKVSFDFDNTIWDPETKHFIQDSINLLKDYINDNCSVFIITHRNADEAKIAKKLLFKRLNIDIPVISCPGETLDSRTLNKNQALLKLKINIHYDDHPEYLKDAIAGGVEVKEPPKQHSK